MVFKLTSVAFAAVVSLSSQSALAQTASAPAGSKAPVATPAAPADSSPVTDAERKTETAMANMSGQLTPAGEGTNMK